MLIEVGSYLVSSQLFERKFVCDLNACKGACCVEGNSGAPLKSNEIALLEDHLEEIESFMTEEGKQVANEKGVFYLDIEREPVTSLINDGACVFAYFDSQGIAKCAVEAAYRAKKINFNKPQSCHLYPIRIKRLYDKVVLAYNEWDICSPACACGERLNVPVYTFLQEPIKRVFGAVFYEELSKVATQWNATKNSKT
jgi:hypothetical protein